MAVADAFAAQLEPVADEIAARVRARWPALVAQPELWARMQEISAVQLRAVARRLAGDGPGPAAEVAEEARLVARAGIPLDAITGAYRVAHEVLWEALIRAVEAEDLRGEARVETLSGLSRTLFALIDEAIAAATVEHTAERDRLRRSHELRHARAVRDVLAGGTGLDWPLGHTHVAAVAWTDAAEAALGTLAARLEARLLLVPASDSARWGWLTATALPSRLPVPDAAGLALGEPGEGVAGFRRSHAQALAAQRVALARRDAGTVRYAAVALEALAGADPEAARAFVAAELGPLAAADPRAAVLRETLAAWCAAGQNAAAAGAALGVHERTVAYRLRTVEDRLGHHPAHRRAELETALRLRALG